MQCQSADTAVRLFESMKAHGIQPDVVTYASLLSALQGPPARMAEARQVRACSFLLARAPGLYLLAPPPLAALLC